ncbi:hypothetical protein ACLE20_03040 [Rhizobium sp. YIM 134829]|uniref:hypothetical protein n=1 Tax=Rhizobium sp. YIM 134829 TaxID=3390453 RepID=UPI00397B254D
MDSSKTVAPGQDRDDRPLDAPHAPEAIESDSQLHDREDETAIDPDDTATLAARREAARQHGDAYIVASDLEDADQREAAPGTREQD